jgi:pretoxin HINT domain-containing protein
MADTSKPTSPGPFSGKGIFVTTPDSRTALAYSGQAQWVAVPPDTPPAAAQELRNAGFKVVVWEGSATSAGVKAVETLHADGYIAQAEGPDQLSAANNIASQIGVPKALVTNNFMPAFPGDEWVAMPEAYENKNPRTSVVNVTNDSYNLGAKVVIPVLGVYDAQSENTTRVPTSQYENGLNTAGSTSYAIYTTDQADPSYVRTVLGISVRPAGHSTHSSSQSSAAVPYTPAALPSPNSREGQGPDRDPIQNATHKKPSGSDSHPPNITRPFRESGGQSTPQLGLTHQPKSPNGNTGGQMPPPNPRDEQPTLYQPTVIGAPGPTAKEIANATLASEYQGGAKVVKTIWGSNGTRTDITETGAVIQTAQGGGTPFRAGWVDPSKASSYDSMDSLKGNIETGSVNPFTHPTTFQPTNPGWGAASDIAKPSSGGHPAEAPAVPSVQSEPPASVTSATPTPAVSFTPTNPGWGNASNVAKPEPATKFSGGSTSVVPDASLTRPFRESGGQNSPPPVPPPPVAPSAPPAPTTTFTPTNPGWGAASDVAKPEPRTKFSGGSSGGATSGGSSGGSSQEIYNPPQIAPDVIPVSGGGACFIAGSKVLTPEGEKAIEEIKLGDMVQTWDMDRHQMVPTQVTDTLAHHDRATLEVVTEGGSLTTTPEHPFWTGNEWLPAGKLKAGESTIQDSSGQQTKVTEVKDGPKANVYNLHVTAPAHNYFVEGLLVHNMKMGL